MPDRYPGYDVLSKRRGPSWNDKTRETIAARLALPAGAPRWLKPELYAVLAAAAERIAPRPDGGPPLPLAALVDDQLARDQGDGYRPPDLPPLREAYERGLAALDAECRASFGGGFAASAPEVRDEVLRRAERGELAGEAWAGLPPDLFFRKRLAHDVIHAYYAHPEAWSEIGFGGPASPRGYVRLRFNDRDPWEAAEAKGETPREVERAARRNRRVR